MNKYDVLAGGVQLQPYDLGFLSDMIREGLSQLSELVPSKNKIVIFSGLEVVNNTLTDGVAVYNGEPISIQGIPDLTGCNMDTLYVVIFTRAINRKVFDGNGQKTQEPYLTTYGIVSKSGVGMATLLRTIKRAEDVLSDRLLEPLRKHFIEKGGSDVTGSNVQLMMPFMPIASAEGFKAVTLNQSVMMFGGRFNYTAAMPSFAGAIKPGALIAFGHPDISPPCEIYTTLFAIPYHEQEFAPVATLILDPQTCYLTVHSVSPEFPIDDDRPWGHINPVTYIIKK